MKVKVPLPDGFFSTPPLSDNLRHEYIRQSQRSLVDFVAKTRLRGGPISWTFDHEHHGVTVYRGKDMHLPSGYRTVYLNVTEVQATLDEAASIMSAGADGRRDYCATYHNDQVVDLKNLYPLATPTPSHPHNSISIKWRAVTANNPLIKLRDMVFIEYCDDFTIDGLRGFGRCMTSIDLGKIVPDLERSLGIVRCHMWLGGDIFVEHRPGYLSVFRIYQQDARGALRPWLVDRFAKHKISQCMASLDRNFRHERVLSFNLLPECAFVPPASRSHCALCRAKFSSRLHRAVVKTHCYKCGEVLCGTCNPLWKVGEVIKSSPEHQAKPHLVRPTSPSKRMVRVCVACTSMRPTSVMTRPPVHSAYSTDSSAPSDIISYGNMRHSCVGAAAATIDHVTATTQLFEITPSARPLSNGSDFPFLLARSPHHLPSQSRGGALQGETAGMLLRDLDDRATPGQLRQLLHHLHSLNLGNPSTQNQHDNDVTNMYATTPPVEPHPRGYYYYPAIPTLAPTA
ncbi:hypothetical protein H257_13264 [Aphanomyces astaci]|uniref:FYVE-type domain-containing protein n=1 Tax=Aphanomyces astaci TaxID=112090 RepID=W4FWP5_APHAT|nr:hypothetical protein H257_13264 [Aphanomyces astaci]ETV71366.1 hypothetical protein H257_13264 [Aphanomyces astaci]|eukprot:XP_009839031.1 hypothetical protein H257_13264 [Aphanomyces astaci]